MLLPLHTRMKLGGIYPQGSALSITGRKTHLSSPWREHTSIHIHSHSSYVTTVFSKASLGLTVRPALCARNFQMPRPQLQTSINIGAGRMQTTSCCPWTQSLFSPAFLPILWESSRCSWQLRWINTAVNPAYFDSSVSKAWHLMPLSHWEKSRKG